MQQNGNGQQYEFVRAVTTFEYVTHADKEVRVRAPGQRSQGHVCRNWYLKPTNLFPSRFSNSLVDRPRVKSTRRS